MTEAERALRRYAGRLVHERRRDPYHDARIAMWEFFNGTYRHRTGRRRRHWG